MVREFFGRGRRSQSGAVAMIFALAIVPIMMLIGGAIDFTRLSTARAAAQAAADAAALAAASSRLDVEATMRAIAAATTTGNVAGTSASGATMSGFRYTSDKREVAVTLTGSIQPMFLGVAGFQTLTYSVTANAIRAVNGSTELVLVLDNTWSMSGNKLVALKSAAEELVTTLWSDSSANIRIGLVPYADYVNVGTGNRNATWLSVPADYDVTSERTCTTMTTKQTCVKGSPKTCTRVVDGVSETYDCTPSTCTTQEVPPYQSCSGGGTTRYRWYGCVGSRMTGTLRLNDTQPSSPYPGYLATSQNCLNPIIPLTNSSSTVVNAIRSMVVNVGSYRPLTYIPAGLIWGVNVISPTMPFSEGAPYDTTTPNRRPRKVIVLMTDGANTLQFRASDGRHIAFSGNATNQAKQLTQTNDDMLAICAYAKTQNIEIFTVAFDITDPTIRQAMQTCATSPAHAFDAADRTALQAAFQSIAASLQNVRLTR